MKAVERKQARELRQKGLSLKEIQKILNVAKSSLSKWVRDIELTKAQWDILKLRGVNQENIERRRRTRLENEGSKRKLKIQSAIDQISPVSKRDLFLIGVALYWGEGTKKTPGVVGFDNSDPATIEVMMQFFRQFCCVPDSKFRGYLHIHPHLDHKKAEIYWSRVSGIPLSQFYKTYRIPPKSSKNKKDTLPFGTFRISICNTELLLKLKGWINGIQQKMVHAPGFEPGASSV